MSTELTRSFYSCFARNRVVVHCLAFVFLFCGCSRSERSDDIPHSDEPVVTVASTTQIEIIQATLSDGVTVADAYAVRSESDDWAHFVSARLTGVDGDDIGLWFMLDGMDVPGDPSSVNDVAKNRSSMDHYAGSINLQERADVVALLALTESRRSKIYP